MIGMPDVKCEATRKEKKSREAKKRRSKEQISREERRYLLETEQTKNCYFTEGERKHNHRAVNIPVAILAQQTAETTLRGNRHFEDRPFHLGGATNSGK